MHVLGNGRGVCVVGSAIQDLLASPSLFPPIPHLPNPGLPITHTSHAAPALVAHKKKKCTVRPGPVHAFPDLDDAGRGGFPVRACGQAAAGDGRRLRAVVNGALAAQQVRPCNAASTPWASKVPLTHPPPVFPMTTEYAVGPWPPPQWAAGMAAPVGKEEEPYHQRPLPRPRPKRALPPPSPGLFLVPALSRRNPQPLPRSSRSRCLAATTC